MDELTINIEPTPNFFLPYYLDGYFRSIHILCDNLNSENNTMFFPCTFAIAQYMELWIKILIKFYNLNPSSKDITGLKLKSHNVLEILKNHSDKIQNCGIPSSEIEAIKNLYTYFSDFADSVDLSEAMRFSIGTQNDKMTFNNTSYMACVEDGFETYKETAILLLKKTNDITKKYFTKIFTDNRDNILSTKHIKI